MYHSETGPTPVAGDQRNMGLAGSTGFIKGVAGVLILAAIGLGVLRYAGGSPVEQGFEGFLGSLAMGMVVAATGILALMGLDNRPALFLPAAVILIPLSFLSFAGVLLPLLIPSGMLFTAFARRSQGLGRNRGTTVITFCWVAGFLITSVTSLFLMENARTYVTPDGGGGSSSDVISVFESLLSLSCTTLAIVGGRRFATVSMPPA